jgi:hypothetical protein
VPIFLLFMYEQYIYIYINYIGIFLCYHHVTLFIKKLLILSFCFIFSCKYPKWEIFIFWHRGDSWLLRMMKDHCVENYVIFVQHVFKKLANWKWHLQCGNTRLYSCIQCQQKSFLLLFYSMKLFTLIIILWSVICFCLSR